MKEFKPYFSPDKPSGPIVTKAKQEYDLRSMLRSVGTKLTLEMICGEILDNAWDKGAKEVVFQFYPLEGRIIIREEETSGMPKADMERFSRFGRFGRKIEEYEMGRHGFGGKEALLALLEEDDQTQLRIFSRPLGSSDSVEMVIPNWWQNLDPDKEWSIVTTPRHDKEVTGRTTFELTGAKVDRMPKSRAALADLADQLGAMYGPHIESGKLSIKVHLVAGSRNELLEVKPVLVPLSDDHYFHQRLNEPTGKKGEGPRINISWGMIDIDAKNKSESEREKAYKISKNKLSQKIRGGRVVIYKGGRRLEEIELSRLRIEGYRAKYPLESFTAKVDVVGGFLEMDLFKTGPAASSKEREDILMKVRRVLAPYVQMIIKESESEKRVSPGYQRKAEEATKVLKQVLLSLYMREQEIGREFGLRPEGIVFQASEVKAGSSGSYVPSLPRGVRPEASSKDRGKGGKESGGKFSIPEIRVSYFSTNSPPFEMMQELEGGKSVIELNLKNPIVKEAFRKASLLFILDLAGRALYAENVLRKNPHDARAFWKAFTEELDRFMDKVSEIEQA